ncbi:hypothetical protein Hanom_Chr10g00902251 [Helianthus anomalus]
MELLNSRKFVVFECLDCDCCYRETISRIWGLCICSDGATSCKFGMIERKGKSCSVW